MPFSADRPLLPCPFVGPKLGLRSQIATCGSHEPTFVTLINRKPCQVRCLYLWGLLVFSLYRLKPHLTGHFPKNAILFRLGSPSANQEVTLGAILLASVLAGVHLPIFLYGYDASPILSLVFLHTRSPSSSLKSSTRSGDVIVVHLILYSALYEAAFSFV